MRAGRSRELRLGVGLDGGAGWHPAAWRSEHVDASRLFTAGYVAEQVRLAESGGLDLVTVHDAFGLQPGGAERFRGRLDPVLAVAAVAPLTHSIGLVPVTDTIHTEPFHLAKNIATLDLVSAGRAGWWPTIAISQAVADLFGRRTTEPPTELWAEAADVVEVVRRLWDSWEDDAVIRDVPTGRYLDRDKVHYVDFHGRAFSVRGPSITPRSPQGQPLVVIDASTPAAAAVAAAQADVIVVEATDESAAGTARDDVRQQVERGGRDPDDVTVLAVVDALLAETASDALAEQAWLDNLSGPSPPPSAVAFTGTGAGLADLLARWFRSGAVDGALVRPAVTPSTLALLARHTVPALRGEGLLGLPERGGLLRHRFGLDRPANRYAAPAGRA